MCEDASLGHAKRINEFAKFYVAMLKTSVMAPESSGIPDTAEPAERGEGQPVEAAEPADGSVPLETIKDLKTLKELRNEMAPVIDEEKALVESNGMPRAVIRQLERLLEAHLCEASLADGHWGDNCHDLIQVSQVTGAMFIRA